MIFNNDFNNTTTKIYAVLKHSIFLMRNANLNFARTLAAIFMKDIVRRWPKCREMYHQYFINYPFGMLCRPQHHQTPHYFETHWSYNSFSLHIPRLLFSSQFQSDGEEGQFAWCQNLDYHYCFPHGFGNSCVSCRTLLWTRSSADYQGWHT